MLESFTGGFVSADNRCLIENGVLKGFAPFRVGDYSIPNNVKYIATGAFSENRNILSINIPNTVTAIEGGAFSGCSNLGSIILGSSVSEIGDWTFLLCGKLKEIISLNVTPPSLDPCCFMYFDNFSTCVVKVPMESVGVYKAAEGWWAFVNIVGLSDDDLLAVGVDSYVSGGLTSKTFNLHGVEVADDYKGLVVRNGKKFIVK